MTLKALERKRKMAETAEQLGIPLEQAKPLVVQPPRKRGRPKGFKVKKIEQKDQYEANEEIESVSVVQEKKERVILRKRDTSKRILDEDS